MAFLITGTIVYFKFYPSTISKALYKSTFISFCIAGTIISILIVTIGLILILTNYDISETIAEADLSSFSEEDKKAITSKLIEDKNQETTVGTALTIVGSCLLSFCLGFLIPLLSNLDLEKANSDFQEQLTDIQTTLIKISTKLELTDEEPSVTSGSTIVNATISNKSDTKFLAFFFLMLLLFGKIFNKDKS